MVLAIFVLDCFAVITVSPLHIRISNIKFPFLRMRVIVVTTSVVCLRGDLQSKPLSEANRKNE
jgi:hypothetical protein